MLAPAPAPALDVVRDSQSGVASDRCTATPCHLQVDVAGLIGSLGSLHPHDALFLPNGDFVVGTWNPGYVSYWKKL